ncbi:A/G-specific adenine glycosylase [Sporolactobacillus inulinus]|uniref:A/G-specific adenine glycosylase n=1 Tax=Sporolactobacillus inulinus TaxID=2078 RepID=A0A4Y1ZDE0_9BACL|nr:A/G-specific adenine glycosylase [Sporolactobacillus inulinus]
MLILYDEQGRFLVEQRPDTGLLAGMWQFPMLSLDEYEDEQQQQAYSRERFQCSVEPPKILFLYPSFFTFNLEADAADRTGIVANEAAEEAALGGNERVRSFSISSIASKGYSMD